MIKSITKKIITGIICVLISATLFGETITKPNQIKPGTKFQNYLKLAIKEMLNSKATANLNKKLDAKIIKLKNLIIIPLEPIVINDKAAFPEKGFWVIKYSVECKDGKTLTYNDYFVAQKEKKPKSFYGIMGNTIASPILVKDTMLDVWLYVYQELENKITEDQLKNDLIVSDSKVIKAPHTAFENGVSFKGVWEEEWTVKVGKYTVPVKIKFTPDRDGKGTTYTIKNLKIN